MIDAGIHPAHRFEEHTGEERLVVNSPTLAGLYTEAGIALAELQGVHGAAPPGAKWRTIEVAGRDMADLLVEWLNELVFHGEHERWVPTEFRADIVTHTRLRIRGRGPTLPDAPSRVKAATCHELLVASQDGHYRAEVVLDV
jgi:SHS2 domain-containing protein